MKPFFQRSAQPGADSIDLVLASIKREKRLQFARGYGSIYTGVWIWRTGHSNSERPQASLAASFHQIIDEIWWEAVLVTA
jgi:hypothetical protein